MEIKKTLTNVRNANANKAELDKTKKANKIAKGGLIGLGLGFIAQGIYIHKTRKKLMIKELPQEVTDADIDKLGKKLSEVEDKFKKLVYSKKEKAEEEFTEVTKEAAEDIFQNPIDEEDYHEVIFDDFHEEESPEESSEEEPEA